MSHQKNHTKKPSLPSIHFLLNESSDIQEPIRNTQQSFPSTTNTAITSTSRHSPPPLNNVNNIKRHHRQSSSISSLPSELQQLSLSAPAHNNYSIPERSENHQPSWMMMAPSSTPLMTTTTATTTNLDGRRHSRASHARSVSDLSMINLVTHPTLPQVVVNRNRHQTHKRSASANTTLPTDMYKIMHSPNSMSNSSLPFIDEHTTTTRARTHSPPDSAIRSSSYTDSPQQKLLFDALNINNGRQHPTLFLNQVEEGSAKLNLKKENNDERRSHSPPTTTPKEYENVMVARDEQTGRYYCPFCNKAFNRPSSLRIHTYSHTGEKPFVCQEEGCGRQFSVQSNMRRHLRVHRLGRAKAAK